MSTEYSIYKYSLYCFFFEDISLLKNAIDQFNDQFRNQLKRRIYAQLNRKNK